MLLSQPIRYIPLCALLVLALPQTVIAQLAVFDDFEYEDAEDLFGSNEWVEGENEQLWYRYLWQGGDEGEVSVDEEKLSLSTTGVGASQIMSGLAVRRSTWAARVNFAEFPEKFRNDQNSLGAKQAFWLYSPMHGSLASEPGKTRWNEIDYEWWSIHSNTPPSTGCGQDIP